MLTLTRAVGERILIGDDIVIEVRAVLDGRHVRIAIDAPRQVPVHRAEHVEAVSAANRAAAETGTRENLLTGLTTGSSETSQPSASSKAD